MTILFGIMIHDIKDPARFNSYLSVIKEEGFDDLLVFTPHHVHLQKKQINGYMFMDGMWQQVVSPFPAISLDLGYYEEKSLFQKMKAVKYHPALPFVGYGLGNKWSIQQQLTSSAVLAPSLPPTQMLQHMDTVWSMLQKHTSVMIKPLNGKGGKGIFRLSQGENAYMLEQDEQILHLTQEELIHFLKERMKEQKYLVQKWIDIRDKHGSVYDIRALVQKNGEGKWQLSGLGVRRGPSRYKITSNLTNGGTAHPAFPFLKKQFGREKADFILHYMRKLALFIPQYLEKVTNRRLVELGLDIAVDRNGRVWILEVNIKPGRSLWRKIDNQEAIDRSIRAPVQYAWYLLKKKKVQQCSFSKG
ncbi:YheC/YheD family protein [Ammoniphilus resinae]|uniref:Glutathione synthase/RimK-type ligase-like ATP-grasp enzyme n=1 Tax=Ammoniphilus resinae TaxID=861532 RepID=A0ABS4GUM0_9BACL|nr:YheC/YheD family protein [Ammoniphilus resinae]MBP1933962.1 glutathione synthase/RimK-type ligase-like ATP-grasp enzyme [Ammoniphilus resinae]